MIKRATKIMKVFVDSPRPKSDKQELEPSRTKYMNRNNNIRERF